MPGGRAKVLADARGVGEGDSTVHRTERSWVQ